MSGSPSNFKDAASSCLLLHGSLNVSVIFFLSICEQFGFQKWEEIRGRERENEKMKSGSGCIYALSKKLMLLLLHVELANCIV